jgi:hypothetical protein
MIKKLKKIIAVVFLLNLSFRLFAPGGEFIVVFKDPAVEPFKNLIYAIGKVETGFDTLAYNPIEEAVGYFQIRPIRLKDYNRRTGENHKMRDLFNYDISEKIFLYYASLIGPYNFEKIAKNWNGSGPSTAHYWKRVKKYL